MDTVKQLFCTKEYIPFESASLSEEEYENLSKYLPQPSYQVTFTGQYIYMPADYWQPSSYIFSPRITHDSGLQDDIQKISDERIREWINDDFESFCDSIIGDVNLFEEDF